MRYLELRIKLEEINYRLHRMPPQIAKFWDDAWKLQHSLCDKEIQGVDSRLVDRQRRTLL